MMQVFASMLPDTAQPRDNIIRRTFGCVWTGDDGDLSILNRASSVEHKDDTIFHAFCLLRRLARNDHPSEIPYIMFERDKGTWYPSKALRALQWLTDRP